MCITLSTKLARRPFLFTYALIQTGRLVIAENSSRDACWGAKPFPEGFRGRNILGRLLTELRDRVALTCSQTPVGRQVR